MRRLGALAVLCAACTTPSYGDGHLRCAATGAACPSGFYCAGDQHCWRNGNAPDLAGLALDAGDVDLAGVPADLATPSLCGSGAGVLLCDGFEAAAIDAQWTATQRNGSVTLDATRAYRGAQSLHAHTNASPPLLLMPPDASLNEMRTFPVALGTIYLRAWMYLKGPLPTNANIALFNLVDNASGGVEIDSEGGHPALNDNSMPNSFAASTSMFPTDRWFCLQLSLPQGAATGTVSLFVDGSEVKDARLGGAAITPIVGLYLGIELYMPPMLPALDAWFDEIIVDDKPTTCAQ
jgi:hypothetical protein